MANSYCKHLSNSFKFIHKDNKLHYQPCCWVPMLPITDKQTLTDARLKITAIVESNKHTHCYECFYRETTSQIPPFRKSYRLRANDYIPDAAVDGDAYTLDFQIDTNCNAACVICGPHFSSLWQKQNKVVPIQDSAIDLMKSQALSSVEYDKVTMIRFMGGEPMLTTLHKEVLELVLKSAPDPSIIEIIYSTNGSIYPHDDVLKLWSHFKKIILSTSIDGTGEQFEYIRWPLKWDRVSLNIAELAKISKVEPWINYTVNPLNAMYVPVFEQWITEVNKTHDVNIGFQYSPCYGYWGLTHTPLSLINDLKIEFPIDHPVLKLIQNINKSPGIDNGTLQLIDIMNKLDKARDLNWRETFSKVAHHFK